METSAELHTKSLWSIRGIVPFFVVAFINAFVDLGHKIVIQNTVLKVYSGSALVMTTAVIQALILVPFVLAFSPAGFLSDKFPKDKVIRYASFVAIPIALGITFCYYHGWFVTAFWLTIALALQAAFYSPSKYGFIKELVGVKNIASANSVMQGLTIAAILLGTLAYSKVFEHFYTTAAKTPGEILMQVKFAGWLLVASCTLEWLMAQRIPRVGILDQELNFNVKHYLQAGYLRDNLRDAWGHKTIRNSILGLAIVMSINQVLISSFGAYMKETSGEVNTVVINGILAMATVGIALGAAYAARMSKDFIETGLIPFGVAGTAVSLFLLPHLTHAIPLAILFTAFGFFGGMLLVPFNSLIQYHTRENTAGHIIAANNFIQNIIMLLFLAATIITSFLGVSQRAWFYVLAIIAGCGLVLTVSVLPQSMMRQLGRGILSQRYRLQVLGFENIPTEGGVLFLGNHMSWIDWAFLQMASPRLICFVMHREYYERWYLRWFLNRMNVIPISASGSASALSTVRAALQNGDVVALFPEGHISRNGHLSVFRSGFELAAAGTGAQIVPFYIQGMWGSNYSFAAGHYKQTVRGFGSRAITISFGAGMPCDSRASVVKNAVQEMSVSAWSAHIGAMRPLAQDWLRTAKRVGGAPAIFGHDDVHYSGTRLLSTVLFLAPQIARATKGETRVGILLPASADCVLTSLALLCKGKTMVHLNYTYALPLLIACVQKAKLQTVVTNEKFLAKLAQNGLNVSQLRVHCKLVLLKDIHARSSFVRNAYNVVCAYALPAWWLELTSVQRVHLEDTAAIVFSAGKDGQLKGVEFSQRSMIGNIRQIASLINPSTDDIVLSSLPLYHAFGLTVSTFLPLLAGIPMVMLPDPADAKMVGRLCAKHRVTTLFGSNTLLQIYAESRWIHPLMFQHLRLVIAAEEKLREEVRALFRARFGLDVYEGYGTLETTPMASTNIPDILMEDFTVQVGHKPGTVGLPLPGSQFRIVDATTLEPLPAGQEGLVLIGGSQMMKGYLDDPERTAQVMVELDGQRWCKSTDRGAVDADGFLTVVGKV